MLLSIIIVNFNTKQLLQKCLDSIFTTNYWKTNSDNIEIIVVDNASTDGSWQMLNDKYPQVRLIRNKENLGFAKANNLGIKEAGAEYILLLNSDTKVLPQSLPVMMDKFKSDPLLGVIGCKLLNPDGSLQFSAGFFPTLLKVFFWMSFIDDIPLLNAIIKPYHCQNENFYQKDRQVDWVSGACLMVKRETIKKAGLLDENIFMYGEEVEWCYRIKKQAFKIAYTAKASVYHGRGGSSIGSDAGIIEEFTSLIYFYQKHFSSLEIIFLRLLLILGAWLRMVIFAIIDRYPKRRELYAKAIKMVRR